METQALANGVAVAPVGAFGSLLANSQAVESSPQMAALATHPSAVAAGVAGSRFRTTRICSRAVSLLEEAKAPAMEGQARSI